MPPKNDLFSLLEDADNLSKTDLEVYIASIRDIIVEKKEPDGFNGIKIINIKQIR